MTEEGVLKMTGEKESGLKIGKSSAKIDLDALSMDIVVDDVCFSYGKGNSSVPVFKDLVLDIHGPQLVSIIGPNGVGKSTLIHCMNKILQPTEGCVYVGGMDVSKIDGKSLAKVIGYVPYTSSDSFPLNVTETVLMGRFPHSKWGSSGKDLEIVESVLKLLNIEDLALRSFNELSAGQHQKVMLARGLAQEPKILLLDEPTSNLDVRYQVEITRILRDLAHDKGIIIIMISHDINIAAKYSDNMIMLKNGGIYAVGKPSDVVTEDNIRFVYEIGCKVVDDNGRPHVILIDENDKSPEYCGDHFVVDCLDYDKSRTQAND